MKKLVLLLSMLLLGGSICAQTTTVSATVVDPDTTVWANATWILSFQVNTSYPNPNSYTIGGNPLSSTVINQTGTANSSGVLSFTTYQSGAVSPIGSSFNLTICPQARVGCTVFNFQTVGSSQNISGSLNAAIPAPRFLAVSGAYGYADVEAILTTAIGGTYFNVTGTPAQRCYNGSTWQNCNSGGSGSGTVNSGTAHQIGYYVTTGTAISGDTLFTDDGTTLTYAGTGGFKATGGPLTGSSAVLGTPSSGALAALPTGAHGFSCDESSTAGVPATGVDYLRCDATSHTIKESLNGGAEVSLLTVGSRPWSCQPGIGDGYDTLGANTYAIYECWNTTGVAVTISSILCYSNSGSPTLQVADYNGTSSVANILSSAVTCTDPGASGTISGSTYSFANGHRLKFTLVSTTTDITQSTWIVGGTY